MVVPRIAVWRQDLLLPLRPAAAVDERAVLLDPVRRRQHEDFRVDLRRIHPRSTPELRARRREGVEHDQPLELGERLKHLVGVGSDAGRGHAGENHALHLPLERLVVDRHPRRVDGGLRDEVVRVLVVFGGLRAVPGLKQAHHEIAVVGPEEVPGVRIALLRGARGDVPVEVLLPGRRDAQVAGKDFPADGVVGVALDVGVAALSVHPAPRPSHVAEQQLQERGGADELAACGVMGQPDRVDDRHHLVWLSHLADELRDLHELIDGDPGDARDHLRRVARVVLHQKLEDRARVL